MSKALEDVCIVCGKGGADETGYCSDKCFHEDWHIEPADLELEPAGEGQDYTADDLMRELL